MLCKKFGGITAGLFLLCGVASGGDFYAGGNLAFLDVSGLRHGVASSGDTSVTADGDASLTALVSKFGWKVTENFAVEGRLGSGIDDDAVRVNTTTRDIRENTEQVYNNQSGAYENVTTITTYIYNNTYEDTVKLKHIVGVYVRVGIQESDSFYPYVVAGLTEVNLRSNGRDSADRDPSYGLGADIAISDSSAINIEYMKYYDNGGTTIDGFTIGYLWKF